jgi:hypothetical protein
MVRVSAGTTAGEISRQVRDEMDFGSARATAIVGAAFVEDHLQRLIQARLVDDTTVVDEIFGPSSALGSFSAKINIGYLMGLYSKAAHRELDTIRTIRNDFAHELHVNNFDIDTIKDRCANLRVWEQTRVRLSKVDDKEDTVTFENSSEAKPKSQDLTVDFAEGSDRNIPRVRYSAACRFYIFLFFGLLQLGTRPATPEL